MSYSVICMGAGDRPCVISAAAAATAAVVAATTAVAAAADDEDEDYDPPAIVETKIHNDLSFVCCTLRHLPYGTYYAAGEKV